MWLTAHPPVEVPGSIRTLYPSWDLTGRPALPASLADADVVHATNPAGVPPAGPADGSSRRCTIAVRRFPELFPSSWRWLYRAGLRAVERRADAIVVPSRSTADELLAETSIDPLACT